MSIVTLTTDWGLKDFYVGAFKGAILSKCPNSVCVDISNEIPPFDILKASFVLKNSYFHFPKDTIHVVDINKWNERNTEFCHTIIKYNDHFFIGRDNGLFSLAFDSKPSQMYKLNTNIEKDHHSFNIKNAYIDAICHINQNKKLEEIGTPKTDWFEMKNLKPVVDGNIIIGSIIYFDSYENAITNITRSLFNEIGKGRAYKIFFKRQGYYDIEKISKSYHDVELGERLAIFNSSDYLEIALNEGKVASLIGLSHNETIRIEFNNTQYPDKN